MYVESDGNGSGSRGKRLTPPFLFKPGFAIGGNTTQATSREKTIDVDLQSNQIKRHLCDLLSTEFGRDHIGDEIPSGNGGSIDLVVRLTNGQFDFYEIKPATSAKSAIRQALPQLLEYSYRAGREKAHKLVIVSQPAIDEDSAEYLGFLRSCGLPLYYRSVTT